MEFQIGDYVRVVKSNDPEGEFMVGYIGEVVDLIIKHDDIIEKVIVDFAEYPETYCDPDELELDDSDERLEQEIIERQDFVNSKIFELLCDVSGVDLDWDIELIGKIRDVLAEVIVDDLKIMDDQTFYP